MIDVRMPFTLIIRERDNSWAGRPPAVTQYETRDEAEAALADYVRRNWPAEVGTDMPEDEQEMIDEYFDEVLEAYEILEK